MSRKPISKKLRFEVLKRDGFKCQYCGKCAVDVILHIDHILPVSKGGDNSIVNLITSCIDCNLGKSNNEISDSSILKRQIKQMQHMEEIVQQKKMMAKWRFELLKNIELDVSYVTDLLSAKYNISLSDYGKNVFIKTIKKYGLEEVLEAIEISSDCYLKDKNNDDQKNLFLDKIPRICHYREIDKKDPEGAKIRRLVNIANKRWSYCNRFYLDRDIRDFLSDGYEFSVIENAIISSNNSHSFYRRLGE